MGRCLVILIVLAGAAGAEPSVGARMRVLWNPQQAMFGGRLAADYTWVDRWQVGIVAGAVASRGGPRLAVLDVGSEFVAWLHALAKLDVGLGMRLGYVRVLGKGPPDYWEDGWVVEPVVALRVPLGARMRIAVEPLIPTIVSPDFRPGLIGYGATAGIELGL